MVTFLIDYQKDVFWGPNGSINFFIQLISEIKPSFNPQGPGPFAKRKGPGNQFILTLSKEADYFMVIL